MSYTALLGTYNSSLLSTSLSNFVLVIERQKSIDGTLKLLILNSSRLCRLMVLKEQGAEESMSALERAKGGWKGGHVACLKERKSTWKT
jgi:hypothetical protein